MYASAKSGGLGLTELRHAIPQIMLGRIKNLNNYNDNGTLAQITAGATTLQLVARLEKLAGPIPCEQIWKQRLIDAPTLKGLEQANEDIASRQWLHSKPTGWTGKDFVKAVHLRTNNLATKGLPYVPAHERGCRAGCAKIESISHILQNCPATHWERIRRHNNVVKRIAEHTRSKKWATENEPHVRHNDGTLYKPDLAIHKGNKTYNRYRHQLGGVDTTSTLLYN